MVSGLFVVLVVLRSLYASSGMYCGGSVLCSGCISLVPQNLGANLKLKLLSLHARCSLTFQVRRQRSLHINLCVIWLLLAFSASTSQRLRRRCETTHFRLIIIPHVADLVQQNAGALSGGTGAGDGDLDKSVAQLVSENRAAIQQRAREQETLVATRLQQNKQVRNARLTESDAHLCLLSSCVEHSTGLGKDQCGSPTCGLVSTRKDFAVERVVERELVFSS